MYTNIDSIDHKDKYTQIGNYAIHKDKLKYKCTMQLKYWKSRGPITGKYTKPIPLSFNLQQLLISLIENHTLDKDLQKELNFSDTLLMEDVLRKAKIIETLDYKRDKNIILIEQLRHRLFILQGSIIAGNEGREIYKEALDLIEKLYTMDDLSNYDYFQLKKCLKSV
jgi:hypothetical protein